MAKCLFKFDREYPVRLNYPKSEFVRNMNFDGVSIFVNDILTIIRHVVY